MDQFLYGAIVMGLAVATLLFLSYWRRTRQSLFLYFAASFFLLGINYLSLAVTQIPVEDRSPLFLVRLLAFALLIVGIVQSNRGPSR
jgi:4-hydroxybenzoate polyprenyltransferase